MENSYMNSSMDKAAVVFLRCLAVKNGPF